MPATWGDAWLVPQKPELYSFKGLSAVAPAVRPDDVGLVPLVWSGAPAAVRLDGANVVPMGRAHRQHAEVGAFRGLPMLPFLVWC